MPFGWFHPENGFIKSPATCTCHMRTNYVPQIHIHARLCVHTDCVSLHTVGHSHVRGRVRLDVVCYTAHSIRLLRSLFRPKALAHTVSGSRPQLWKYELCGTAAAAATAARGCRHHQRCERLRATQGGVRTARVPRRDLMGEEVRSPTTSARLPLCARCHRHIAVGIAFGIAVGMMPRHAASFAARLHRLRTPVQA
jgi:hypothetical protein